MIKKHYDCYSQWITFYLVTFASIKNAVPWRYLTDEAHLGEE